MSIATFELDLSVEPYRSVFELSNLFRSMTMIESDRILYQTLGAHREAIPIRFASGGEIHGGLLARRQQAEKESAKSVSFLLCLLRLAFFCYVLIDKFNTYLIHQFIYSSSLIYFLILVFSFPISDAQICSDASTDTRVSTASSPSGLR